jgi:hypothetical protein
MTAVTSVSAAVWSSPQEVARGVGRVVGDGGGEVAQRALGVAAVRVAPAPQAVHRRAARVELQHAVAVRDGQLERPLDVQFRGAIGVGLHVVRLQADGLVEVVERLHPVAEFDVGVGPKAIRDRDVRAEPDRAREALHGLAKVAAVERGAPTGEQVLGVFGVPVVRHGQCVFGGEYRVSGELPIAML